MQRRYQSAREFYNEKAGSTQTRGQRQFSEMFEVKSFNNWIKAVLINKYCELRQSDLKKMYDLPSSFSKNLLQVLDIGCGHGQDIKKWALNKVNYLVGVDISPDSLAEYRKRWRDAKQPYAFKGVALSGSHPDLYQALQHTFYDIVSSQLCIHYMFDKRENVNRLLMNSLENLLAGGFLLLTIPDSLSIIKKIRELGKKQGDYYVYGNEYFSMRFKSTEFDKSNGCYGLEYGFYLKEAIGSKDQEGNITYVNEWLIELQNFEQLLKHYKLEIVESLNFIEFYRDNKDRYQSLFDNFKLRFNKGESMKKEFWEIAHLYRVLVAQKTQGKNTRDFPIASRRDMANSKH